MGKLELYPADGPSTVRVGDRDIPLELQPTATLAYQLEGAPVWDFEIAGFRFADKMRLLELFRRPKAVHHRRWVLDRRNIGKWRCCGR